MAAQVVTPTYTYPAIEQGQPIGSFVVHLACTSATGGAIAYNLAANPTEFLAPTGPEGGRRSKWYLYGVMTDPGSTAPTALWDLTVTDAGQGTNDIMGSACLNRSATVTEWAVPAAGFPIPLCGQVAIAVANAGDEKLLTVRLYFSCYR